MNKYTGRRPILSAKSPKSAGANPATIMYDVMVRLIRPTGTCSAWDKSSMAGKKMNDDKGEKLAA